MAGTPADLGDTVLFESGAPTAPGRAGGEAGPLVGRVLAERYELLALLGQGGMGSVFSARDRELDEVVALKLLHTHLGAGTHDRIRREVKLARRITHRNVARTFELGEHEGMRFLTMEFVDGEPLSRVLGRQGRLSAERAAPIFVAVCEALAAAHEAGIVHRDIKPDNVLVEPRGRVVVTDFGVAAFEHEGPATGPSGTPAYMAPEQVEGGELTPQTDLYALGVMMFEVLTGALPWSADTMIRALLRRLEEPPPDPRARVPELPLPIAAIVVRCLERDPRGRPSSAQALAEELRALGHAGGSSTAAGELQVLDIRAFSARQTPIAGSAARTLAVLPFSPNPEVEVYMGEALVEDLVDSLSALKGLRVRARARIEGDDRDPQRIGRALGVGLVVEGSLRRVGPRLRVGLRLVEVESGYQTWAERFEVAPEQLLGVADAATRAIAGALALDERAPARAAPSDPAAIDLYLRARHHYQLFTVPDTRRAVELFQQAAALDPESPVIQSGLSMAAVRLSYAEFGNYLQELPLARAAAERAIARAPHLGEPHLALGHLSLVTGDPVAAARHARAAVARAPGSAEAHELLGRLLFEAGRVPDAERRLRAALELDPRLSVARWELIRLAAFDGDWAGHEALIAASPGPDRERRARWALHVRYAAWRGDPALLAEIEEEMRADPVIQPAFRDINLMVIGVYRGKHPAGPVLAAIASELARMGRGTRMEQWVLQLSVELAGFAGEKEAALSLLERAAEAGVFDLLWLDRCPLLRRLRDEPRFAAVRAEVRARADAIADAVWSG